MIVQEFVSQAVKKCDGADCAGLPKVVADQSQLSRALTMLFGTIAAVAVITLMIAAINFATAGSDTEKISRSKKSIIYALVGLVIAVSAEVIVLTLIGRF